jgi:hypothetical protein
MPRCRDPAQAVHMLDLLAEFFDGGRRWLKNNFHDGDGNRCLISALAHLRAVMKVQGDGTAYYLRLGQRQDVAPEAVRRRRRNWVAFCIPNNSRFQQPKSIIAFNDESQSFDAIRTLIRRARALAKAELETVPLPLERRPRFGQRDQAQATAASAPVFNRVVPGFWGQRDQYLAVFWPKYTPRQG